MNNVIYYFHFDGNYYAGDHIDIHDNTSVNLYQGENTKETSTHEACVEDVVPIVEQAPCPFLVTEKLTKLGPYTPDQFENMFRKAAESDAKTLAAFLKKYRQMGLPCDADESLLRQGLQHRDKRPLRSCSEHAARRDARLPSDAHSQLPLQPRFRYPTRRTRQTYKQRGQRKRYLEWYEVNTVCSIATKTKSPKLTLGALSGGKA